MSGMKGRQKGSGKALGEEAWRGEEKNGKKERRWNTRLSCTLKARQGVLVVLVGHGHKGQEASTTSDNARDVPLLSLSRWVKVRPWRGGGCQDSFPPHPASLPCLALPWFLLGQAQCQPPQCQWVV